MKPKIRAKIQFTLQGLINQFGFFLLLSSSKNIALSFGKKNLVSFIMFAANIASVLILFINAMFLMKYAPRTRLIWNAFIMFSGYLVIAVGLFTNFYLIVFGALLTGTGSAFGQVIHYGFIKSFPSEFVGPFSSGTGICGFIGSLLYMIFSSLNGPDWTLFCGMLPVIIFYLFNFLNLHSFAKERSFFNEKEINMKLIESDVSSGMIEEEINMESESIREQTLMEGYKKDPLNHLWIFALYFFEYSIITGFFDRLSQLRTVKEGGFLEDNLFTVTQFLYQFGVLIARSSLYCIKSKMTGLMTMIL